MPTIKISAAVEYGDILAALGIDEIEGVDFHDADEIKFDDAEIDSDEALGELESARLLPEPETPEIRSRDLRDAFGYLASGQSALACTLFVRALGDCGDERLATAIEESCRAFHRAEPNG